MEVFNEGDEVRFIGDINSFIKSFQPILKRRGIVVRGVLPEDYPDRKYRSCPDKVLVKWIPKTSRGREETHYFRAQELEIVKRSNT